MTFDWRVISYRLHMRWDDPLAREAADANVCFISEELALAFARQLVALDGIARAVQQRVNNEWVITHKTAVDDALCCIITTQEVAQ